MNYTCSLHNLLFYLFKVTNFKCFHLVFNKQPANADHSSSVSRYLPPSLQSYHHRQVGQCPIQEGDFFSLITPFGNPLSKFTLTKRSNPPRLIAPAGSSALYTFGLTAYIAVVQQQQSPGRLDAKLAAEQLDVFGILRRERLLVARQPVKLH